MKLTKLDWLLLLTLSVLTFEKIRWETSDLTLTWTNLLAAAFVVAFVADRIRRRDLLLHPAAITLAGFMLAFAAVYLAGYFDLQDKQALAYWLKGLGAWGIHFLYLILGVAHMARRGRPLYVRAVYAFTAGLVVNCVYGVTRSCGDRPQPAQSFTCRFISTSRMAERPAAASRMSASFGDL